jgi:hypothetical protein
MARQIAVPRISSLRAETLEWLCLSPSSHLLAPSGRSDAFSASSAQARQSVARNKRSFRPFRFRSKSPRTRTNRLAHSLIERDSTWRWAREHVAERLPRLLRARPSHSRMVDSRSVDRLQTADSRSRPRPDRHRTVGAAFKVHRPLFVQVNPQLPTTRTSTSRAGSIVPCSSGPRRPKPCYTNERF